MRFAKLATSSTPESFKLLQLDSHQTSSHEALQVGWRPRSWKTGFFQPGLTHISIEQASSTKRIWLMSLVNYQTFWRFKYQDTNCYCRRNIILL